MHLNGSDYIHRRRVKPSGPPEASGMPNYGLSKITVEWDPRECEGTLEIEERWEQWLAEREREGESFEPSERIRQMRSFLRERAEAYVGDAGYVPPDEGTVEPLEEPLWLYRAFLEPRAEPCPKDVTVSIAAMAGDQELDRETILVLPVHKWLTNGHQHGPGAQQHPPDTNDFWLDYDYLSWKYGGVLATTGGAFPGGVTISTDPCVPCGFPSVCVAACTHPNRSVDFGTTAFTQSENATASTIGHELVHTTGSPLPASECEAYTWEMDHSEQTGIFQCDAPYLVDVAQNWNCACYGCP